MFNHFKLSEFDSPDAPGSGDKMDNDFVKRLDRARAWANMPFKINSGYRTKAYNTEVGGVPDSSHKKGVAADIEATDSRTRYKVLDALLEVGFQRIGIYDTFIHVDQDAEKSKEVIWTG